MKVLQNPLIIMTLVVVVIVLLGISAFNTSKVEVTVNPVIEIQSPIEKEFGSKLGTAPVALSYDNIATSTITTFNAMAIATSTPTTTEYISLGTEIDQVDMFLWAQVTSTDNSNLGWKLSFSPETRATSTIDFYFEDSNSISSSVITHVADDVTHILDIGDANVELKKITICGANSDSAANTKISPCNAGWYKIEIGRTDGMSGFEIYTSVVGKQR